MARRRSGRAVSRQKDQVWAVSLFQNTDIGSGVTAVLASLVDKTDWHASGSSSQRATLLRVRGWFSMRQETAAGVGAPGPVYLYVTNVDEDATVAIASNPNTYADEDILWTGGVQCPSLGDATVRSFTRDWILDIKAMRKIRSGQRIDLAVTNTTTQNVEFSGVIRSLVRIGGN